MKSIPHILSVNERISSYEDGLLLGNGDLSVSIYQKVDQIVWRFGKGDVWDRRMDISRDSRPLTMDELRHGLVDEGWCVPPYGGPIQAMKGSKDAKRMRECLTPPPSHDMPYPMPKPVGELALHWPADLQGLTISQKIFIEENRCEIRCAWPDGETLDIECYIPPKDNVLVVRWRLEGFDQGAPQAFHTAPPVRLELYRWPDPPFELWNSRFWARNHYAGLTGYATLPSQPLPPPETLEVDGLPVIRQGFYPDPLFPDGFEYYLGCFSGCKVVEPIDTGQLKEAQIRIADVKAMSYENLLDMSDNDDLQVNLRDYVYLPPSEGWVVVPVTTSSDQGGCLTEYRRIKNILGDEPEAAMSRWRQETQQAAREFWSASALTVGEKVLENMWYENLHASRCIYRAGTVPPGLFLPSTVGDYSNWKGDYHTQYNLVQPFWGVHTANHAELAEAFFTAVGFLVDIGRKIAHDYCGTRGIFIQVTGYPIAYEEDPFPTGPMGRMTYMTGWMAEIFWWHFLYSQDRDYLKTRGYPFIRDCALFYTDYLEKRPDGLYHAFPSCFGEEGFDGTGESSTDITQTMDYAAFSMRMALRAAQVLDVDQDLQEQWRDRLEHLAPSRGDNEFRALPQAAEERHQTLNPPDFRPALLFRFNPSWTYRQRFWGWIDKMVRQAMQEIRGGIFKPERDLQDYVDVVRHWRHPNGLIWGMPIRFFGHEGAWTESLGIYAPVQEMLLQSWEGFIRLFPCWDSRVQVSFKNFKAEGGFLVSATVDEHGQRQPVIIESLNGNPCVVHDDFPEQIAMVTDSQGCEQPLERHDQKVSWSTRAGERYELRYAEIS